MPRHLQADTEFRIHVCQRIDSYIREKGITDVRAATDLGVTKTQIGDYRRAKVLPGTEVLAMACIHWGLSFDYKGFTISANAFVPQNGRPKSVPRQLVLPFDEVVEFLGVSPRVEAVRLSVKLSAVS